MSPPPPADGRLNKIIEVDQTPNLACAGPRGDKGNQGSKTEPDKEANPYKHMESKDTKRGREIKRT